jgi:streptogramin lyase
MPSHGGAPSFEAGTTFAGYRIEGVAGRGGMGVVYRATELALERTVALKVIAPELAKDVEFRRRFIAESKAAAAIEHQHVLPVFYAGEREGVLFIAMRFIEGDDLRVLIRAGGPLAAAAAADVIRQVASALDAAHARGLIHRDIKPANILLDRAGHAYLTDFGLTKRIHDATDATRTGDWVRTVGYVAPEQIRGEKIDARADVYALGCVLYHALTGRPPFAHDLEATTIWAHLEAPPPSVGDAAPRGFDPVIARALAKDPADRYPSAGDLGAAAVAAAEGRSVDTEEREVATGPAAHGEEQSVTRVMPARPPSARSGPIATPRRRALLGAALAAALAVPVAIVVLGGGSDSSKHSGPRAGARVVATVSVPRPDGLAYARGGVWVTSYRSRRLTRVDTRSNRSTSPVTVPRGSTTITAGFGSLWVANQPAASVTRIGLTSKHSVGTPIDVAPGRPFVLAKSSSGIWAGNRAGAKGDPASQAVVRIDPNSGLVAQRIPIPLGVQDVAVGFGAVWVTNRRRRSVERIDLLTGAQKLVALARVPGQLAIGGGFVWVANPHDDIVTRIEPATFHKATISVGRGPSHLAIGKDGSVWVTNSADSTLTRIDARSGRQVGASLKLLLNPGDLLVTDRTVWVASVGASAVQRVDY